MALGYSKGCVNFREVGESVNFLAAQTLLPEGKIFRCGRLDYVSSTTEVCSPRTIISLRKCKDELSLAAKIFNFPFPNNYEKYETNNDDVRQWLNKVIQVFEDRQLGYPVLIHCALGKDRTGVVIAALLKILDVPEEIIIKEYLLSEGEVEEEWIRRAMAGIGDPWKYFDCANIEKVRENILRSED